MRNKYAKPVSLSDDQLYSIILRPLITEKVTKQSEHNKISFLVANTANKKEIRFAVEKLWNVKVRQVNTIVVKGKTKRFRGKLGYRSDIKKAIVTLDGEHTIDFSAGIV